MPWTFAHPAAVLPLRAVGPVRPPLLGLVIGSMAPDLVFAAAYIALAIHIARSGPAR